MALNFPNSPTLNQVYTDSTSGFSYQWNGTVWISFSATSSSQIKTLDDISASFNSSTTIFPLTSSGNAITPPSPQSLIINLGGVIQDATDDYSVSGSNIVFSTAPTNGLSFSGISLGPAIPVTVVTIPDGTVTGGSLTVAGLLSTTNLYVSGISTFIGIATHTGTIFGNNLSLTGIVTATSFVGSGANLTGIANTANIVSTAITTGILNVGTAVTINSSGINVTGITTITNASGTVTIGIGTTALLVEGNARVTGILTVGSASITLNGSTNIINVGTGLTLGSSGINVTGVITATSFVGDGSGLTGVGIGTNGSVNTTGIITATSVNDSIGNVRDIPQNSQISAYQLQSTDAGKHISITTGGITVPSSVFSVGDAVSIYNNSVSNQTITQGASVTLRQVGTANTGNRTLAQYGLATVLCVASNTFAISGGGLS
jgi:hypothetical protein